jgi:DNA-binding NtrC family response regulator
MPLKTSSTEWGLIGESLSMQKIRSQIGRMAPFSTSVLITGETGTGKEIVARLLHQQSHRTFA